MGRRDICALWGVAALVFTFSEGLAKAETLITLPAPGSEAWKPLAFPTISRHTTYTVVSAEESATIHANSDCAASALVLGLEGIDLRRTPRLRWRWKVEQRLEIRDERSKSGDDFAARVYVMFRAEADHSSLWKRIQRGIGTRLTGDEMPTHALNYVWASRALPGSQWPNPFNDASTMIALRSGADGKWQSEEVDVAADYGRFVSRRYTPPLALAVMSDSDNTCQKASAYFADFRFVGPDPGASDTEELGQVPGE